VGGGALDEDEQLLPVGAEGLREVDGALAAAGGQSPGPRRWRESEDGCEARAAGALGGGAGEALRGGGEGAGVPARIGPGSQHAVHARELYGAEGVGARELDAGELPP